MTEPRLWYVYIVETTAGRLYTGVTVDLTRRLIEHYRGVGSKALRGDPPEALRHAEAYDTRGDALRREAAIKRLSRSQKLRLIDGNGQP